MSVDQGLAAIARMRRRPIIWGVLAGALGLALGLVPLFGVLGYELALALAGFAAVCSLDLGAALARSLQEMPAPGITRAAYPGRTVAGTAVCAAALPIAVIAIPAVICAVRGIWVPTCDWTFGV